MLLWQAWALWPSTDTGTSMLARDCAWLRSWLASVDLVVAKTRLAQDLVNQLYDLTAASRLQLMVQLLQALVREIGQRLRGLRCHHLPVLPVILVLPLFHLHGRLLCDPVRISLAGKDVVDGEFQLRTTLLPFVLLPEAVRAAVRAVEAHWKSLCSG